MEAPTMIVKFALQRAPAPPRTPPAATAPCATAGRRAAEGELIDLDRIRRHELLGGLIHEYRLAA
jgi:hypothetical protein